MDNSSDEEDESNPRPTNAFDVLQPPSNKQCGEVDQRSIMVIYIRWLEKIPKDHPLYGLPYVGQAVRSKDKYETIENLANARWSEEDSRAKSEYKCIGLGAALREFGPAAFRNEIVFGMVGSYEELQRVADHREQSLIAFHGGPLRRLDVRVHQCLNLDSGGKGFKFESMQAFRSAKWNVFGDHLSEYIAEYGNSRVPSDFVTTDGYKLGVQVGNVRSLKTFIVGHPDGKNRTAWLDSLPGWCWNIVLEETLERWNKFATSLEEYVVRHETSVVPLTYTDERGYSLGRSMMCLRSFRHLLRGHPKQEELVEILECLPNWSWNQQHDRFEESWNTFVREMDAYVSKYHTSLVPYLYVSPSGFKLGERLKAVRRHPPSDKSKMLWLHGLPDWTFNVLADAYSNAWDRFRNELSKYVCEHGTSRVPTRHVSSSGYKLGKQLNDVRTKQTHLKNDANSRIEWLQSLPHWTWNLNESNCRANPSNKRKSL